MCKHKEQENTRKTEKRILILKKIQEKQRKENKTRINLLRTRTVTFWEEEHEHVFRNINEKKRIFYFNCFSDKTFFNI